MPKFVKTLDGHDEDDAEKTDKLIIKANEQLFALIYLENADQDKYGSILKDLKADKALGIDKYPRAVVEANNVLSAHQFDKPIKKQDKNNTNKQSSNSSKSDSEEVLSLSFAQMEGRCYCCGKVGHN